MMWYTLNDCRLLDLSDRLADQISSSESAEIFPRF